ncbi:MAG TPA: efflux RND transporter periplasmic adaptor subunit [Pseudomonadales bacterium]|nr:efflux RND transporter periplasmic adaptor subunit [Pseudomonadales bacterium]
MTDKSHLRRPAQALALALLAVLSGCSKPQQAAEAPPPEVQVVSVEQKDVPIYREWVGSLAGDVDATISAQVSGYLLKQEYREGQYVKAGDVLFQIDPRTYQAVLDEATARMVKTEQDVQRYTPLAKTQAISQQELDDAIQANLAAKAAVDAAQLNVQFCRITSPVDGVAGLAQAQIGDLLSPATGPLTTVVKTDPIKVYFSVSQDLMTQIQMKMLAAGKMLRTDTGDYQGPPLELVLLSGETYPVKGRVKFANNQVDVRTGTVRVCGEFSNPQTLLLPGMFVTVRALFDTATNALLVPQKAVTDMQGTYLVAVVDADNKISIRPVKAGERVGENWIITGNIKAGDRVVSEGIQKVRDGITVNPVAAGSTPADASAALPSKQTP